MSFFRNWFYLYLKQTAAESAFEREIAKMGEPYRTQYPFPSLRRVADFALHLRKIVIEIDGASHDTLEQRRKDLVTSIALEEKGWRVIRFQNAEVMGWVEGSIHLSEIIDSKLRSRPTLAELRTALASLPEPLVKRPKRRARKRVPAPKSAP